MNDKKIIVKYVLVDNVNCLKFYELDKEEERSIIVGSTYYDDLSDLELFSSKIEKIFKIKYKQKYYCLESEISIEIDKFFNFKEMR